MQTWIFQANPDRFDVDAYLANSSGEIVWAVNQHASDISVGDSVFLWRAKGRDASRVSGVIAECKVIEPVADQPDDPESQRYWNDPNDATSIASRVRLRLERVAKSKEVLKKQWLEDDSVLAELLILRRPTGTNFTVSERQAERLFDLWGKTGVPWSRAEVIAAMHLYEDSRDQPISRTAGSPVEQLAQRIGRAPTGVYNKLMNLRALDTRAEQAGLSGGSVTDARVWDEYFDPVSRSVDTDRLETDFKALWSQVATEQSLEAAEASLNAESNRLAQRTYEELLAAYNRRRPHGAVQRRSTTATAYERSPLVVALTRTRANYTCEVSGCENSTFDGADDNPFVEVHHLVRLADGGVDTITNTVCVCPNHHRELHHGKNREALKAELEQIRHQDADQD